MTTRTANENSNLSEFDREPLPNSLNVLTILTFIGCALSFLGNIWSFIKAKQTYLERDKVLEQMSNPKMPVIAKRMMGDPQQYIEMVTKSYENRIPILIIGLLSVALCFVGALQMRKMQNQGFLFYAIGELLPFVSFIFFIGTFMIGGFAFIFYAVIAILFISLYAINRKYLIY